MSTTEVPVPEGMTPEDVRRLVEYVGTSRSARARVASVMEQHPLLPATAAQLALVEQRWRHLATTYGTYGSSDIATLRGAKPSNRSVATNLARTHGLIGFTRGRQKHYPRFQFKGREIHPHWQNITRPLLDAGWSGEDVLLWLATPNSELGGREPAAMIDTGPEELMSVVEREASGVW